LASTAAPPSIPVTASRPANLMIAFIFTPDPTLLLEHYPGSQH
jgi:hypothetical protein